MSKRPVLADSTKCDSPGATPTKRARTTTLAALREQLQKEYDAEAKEHPNRADYIDVATISESEDGCVVSKQFLEPIKIDTANGEEVWPAATQPQAPARTRRPALLSYLPGQGAAEAPQGGAEDRDGHQDAGQRAAADSQPQRPGGAQDAGGEHGHPAGLAEGMQLRQAGGASAERARRTRSGPRTHDPTRCAHPLTCEPHCRQTRIDMAIMGGVIPGQVMMPPPP
eukprot:4922994-Prymnesium_polylepis.1